ncbi:hypothetical protein [Clostridium sp. HBUAS56017]|uniref:hypothetical protein n=1 Tax=Clostridium sp. HBUAS56017 TaxID=2571128 RepID=UPI001177D37E|nr:hypothetical protein [Clostridium sp. HBUAS56017]
MDKKLINAVWHKDSRNSSERILSDYYNGFRLILKSYKKGYKFYVSIRRHKKHGIGDNLTNGTPVAYFKDCSLDEAKVKGIEHYLYMIS